MCLGAPPRCGSRKKLDPKAWNGIFVGYSETSPAYRIYNPRSGRITVSRNVTFDEHDFVTGRKGRPGHWRESGKDAVGLFDDF